MIVAHLQGVHQPEAVEDWAVLEYSELAKCCPLLGRRGIP